MPRVTRIAEIEEHQVRSGETLEGVAQTNGLTWEQLAKYNWNTTDPQEVNNRLRTHVGCTRRPPNSRFYVFDDRDDPGIILIPSDWRETGLETDREHTIRVVKKEVKPNLASCCSIPGITFEYDRSFIRPGVVHYLGRLERELQEHPIAKLLIYGHTDRCGPDDYNKKLSDRRAKSTYAFVTHQPGVWEMLYGTEHWGVKPVQEMLADLGHDPGPIDGDMGSRTKSAMRSFLGLAETAPVENNAAFREQLFRRYMTSKWATPLTDERFAEPKFVGCGEFNPAVAMNDNERNNRAPGNEPNRRVIFYLFDRPPRDIPCRYYDIGPCRTECAKEPEQRNDRGEHPPFGCAFYDRIAIHCPCECELVGAGDEPSALMIRLFDPLRRPLPFAPYVLHLGEESLRGRADPEGWVLVEGISTLPESCRVQWGWPSESAAGAADAATADSDFVFDMDVFVQVDDGDPTEASNTTAPDGLTRGCELSR